MRFFILKATGVCNDTSIEECANTDGCTIDADGSAKCFCKRGFELAASGTSCIGSVVVCVLHN